MKKRLGINLIMIILCFICSTMTVAADTGDMGYATKNFDVNVEITEDYVFHFTETITVDFDEERHGIYRYITKDERAYEIKNVQVKNHHYEIYDEEELTIQIGNPGELVKGKQIYALSYDIVGFKDRNPEGDILYLDVLPTGWETPIDETNITVQFPKCFELDDFQVHFGQYGDRGNNQEIQYSFSDDGLALTINGKNLNKGSGITISAELPEGYWVNPKNHDWLMYVILILFVGGIVFGAVNWYRYGRDEDVIKTVEFYPPDSMTPAEIAYIAKCSCGDEDLSAMFLYFADKGYMSIDENGTGQFTFKRLTKKLPETEPGFARLLFNGMFKSADVIAIHDLPDGLARRYEKSRELLEKRFEANEKRLFTKKSEDRMIILMLYHMGLGILPCLLGMILGVEVFSFSILLLIFLAGSAFYGLSTFMSLFDQWTTSKASDRLIHIGLVIVILGFNYWMNCKVFYANFQSVIFCIAFVVLSLVLAFFAAIMQSRTATSNQMLGRVLGFRDFIETAELERLKTLSKENPEYYFHIMPYAFVLGLSDKWTEHFMNQIAVDAPVWYSGNCVNTADLFWYNHLAGRCLNSINTSIGDKIFDEENPEDGAGGGGGGFFSGGGFGGGGGGAW